jgi:hypothetical protein
MKSQLKTWWRRAATIGLGSVMALATSSFQARGQFIAAQKWSDWMCIGQELCLTGDFNGDGRDDAIAFVRNTQPGVPQGDLWVALSNGSSFGPRQKWHDWIGSNGEVCAVGDFNGDGRDDVAVFVRSTQAEPGRGDVWVYLSTGIKFGPAQKWSDFMCVGQQVCSVGDFNGDGWDDIIAFVRDTQTLSGRGDAWVALSNGSSFGPRQKWSDWFCIGQEVCATGDFNNDGRDDVIAFVRDTQTGVGRGDVWVALSNGSSFGPAQKWSDWMCLGQQVCGVGDFDGNDRDDAIAFERDTGTGPNRGDVWVARSAGGSFLPATKWSDWMCLGQQVCGVGNFDGLGGDDVIAFERDTGTGPNRGDVWVALAAEIIE